MPNSVKKRAIAGRNPYAKFTRINGDHPLKKAVPNIFVGYDVHARLGGDVTYFNFELAKEMGLINDSHPHNLTQKLKKQLLDTFAIQIINEFDVLNKTKIPKHLVKKNQYMATRYLQLQHPTKDGMTSGDGRSVWNGVFESRKGIWDISSCGTGATRLSPAAATEKKFFRTGSRNVSYGCGRAVMSEGLISAIFSEILTKNGINTERTLAVINFKNGTAVNVRAGKNLLRPAHFFGFVKRNKYDALKNLVNYHLEREIVSGNMVDQGSAIKNYQALLAKIARDFSVAAATLESEYVFCWMDWDGDNILMDGGIIDYGTIRQFGLFHHEYRYDDVNKMSTTIIEQKNKAKYTVQIFAQAIDYLITGEKETIENYKHCSAIEIFDVCFETTLLKLLLKKIGFTAEQQDKILIDENARKDVIKFQKNYRYFEKAISNRRTYKVADGITRDAIFCMRDFLREFPVRLNTVKEIYNAREFIDVIASRYASLRDKNNYYVKTSRIQLLQKQYCLLLAHCEDLSGISNDKLLSQLVVRAAKLNPYNRLTGNALLTIVDKLKTSNAKLRFSELQAYIYHAVNEHVCDPDFDAATWRKFYRTTAQVKALLAWTDKQVRNFRASI